MYELASQLVLTPDQLILVGSCVLAGLAVGAGLYVLARAMMHAGGAELGAEFGAESRALALRGQGRSGSGLLGLAMVLMPVFLPASRRLPLAGLRRSFGALY